jgi:hypothetical protein
MRRQPNVPRGVLMGMSMERGLPGQDAKKLGASSGGRQWRPAIREREWSAGNRPEQATIRTE